MSKKVFPDRGHCLSTNPIIVNYLKNNFEEFAGYKYPKEAGGVAWSKGKWWYITNHSSTPEYSPSIIMNMITGTNEMNNLLITGALSTSSGTMTDITITDSFYIYNPNDIIWKSGKSINIVTEPIKLRIKCRNLKKSLKVSLLQINLK